jgi:hypothetical protein
VNAVYDAVMEGGYAIENPIQRDWGLELEVIDPDGNHLYILI